MPENVFEKRVLRLLKYGYLVTLFVLTLTGFAQMPIFKRYYIADIPGLGWLAEFYVTHYIHYAAAAVFLGLTAYFISEHLLGRGQSRKVTSSGYIRAVLLAGIVVSGILLVMRNSLFAPFSPGTVILLDISHLGFVMTFLLAAFVSVIRKRGWTTKR